MIHKAFGLAFIVGVSGWMGLHKAQQLSLRTRGLRQLRMDLSFLEKEIDFARSPLVQALEKTTRVSAFPVKELFGVCCQTLASDRSITAKEAWEVGVGALKRRGGFTSEDLAIISLIGERMGTSDVNDQVRLLRLAVEELKVQEEKSYQRESTEKKLWSYGGFLTGLMIGILMI